MSAATSSIRASIDAPEGLSKGTITATPVSTFAILASWTIETDTAWDKGRSVVASRGTAAHALRTEKNLRELVRTNDIVLVSAVGALLDGANIHHLVLDQNMSIIEGSLGILPRRILVHEDDARAARQILADAGLSHELRPDE
jgi:transketolase N-terminal domain/subunit